VTVRNETAKPCACDHESGAGAARVTSAEREGESPVPHATMSTVRRLLCSSRGESSGTGGAVGRGGPEDIFCSSLPSILNPLLFFPPGTRILFGCDACGPGPLPSFLPSGPRLGRPSPNCSSVPRQHVWPLAPTSSPVHNTYELISARARNLSRAAPRRRRTCRCVHHREPALREADPLSPDASRGLARASPARRSTANGPEVADDALDRSPVSPRELFPLAFAATYSWPPPAYPRAISVPSVLSSTPRVVSSRRCGGCSPFLFPFAPCPRFVCVSVINSLGSPRSSCYQPRVCFVVFCRVYSYYIPRRGGRHRS